MCMVCQGSIHLDKRKHKDEQRMTFAHVVERKGPVDSTARRLVAELHWPGSRRLVFKSDQEPAIFALIYAVPHSMPTIEFVMEESLVEEHQSNVLLKSRGVDYKNKPE